MLQSLSDRLADERYRGVRRLRLVALLADDLIRSVYRQWRQRRAMAASGSGFWSRAGWCGDLKFGVRLLYRDPGTTVLATAAFGLGIGLSTVAFAVFNGTVLRGLPFERAAELVHFERANRDAGIESLATLPENQGRGHASRLLAAARKQMVEDGGLIATLSAPHRKLFARDGFFACGHHSFSQADVRSVLANMPTQPPSLLGRKRSPLNLRLWRHFELPALMRLYRQNIGTTIGSLYRSEAYWRWLISRAAFDQIVIAIDGPDRLSLEEGSSPIVGYAVVKGDQILELMTKPGHPTVARQLLARVCRDAIEHDYHSLVLHAPPQEPLHELLVLAGGSYHRRPAAQHEVFMVSPLVEVATLLARVCDELHLRARAAELSRPCQLGLQLDDETLSVGLTRRSVKVGPGSLGRNFLRASQVDFLRLLLGHHHLDDAIASGRIECSTPLAAKIALAVFPNVSLWRPPWDRMPG